MFFNGILRSNRSIGVNPDVAIAVNINGHNYFEVFKNLFNGSRLWLRECLFPSVLFSADDL